MKIAYDHQTFINQSYGGISRYYTILAGELLKQNQDVGVFAGIHRNNYVEDLPADVVRGYKLAKYPPKTGRIFQWLNHGISQAQMKLWQPDIIHETYYSALSRLSTDAVRVTTVHDMIHELYSERLLKRDRTTQWKKKTFSRVDHILSISYNTKKDLIELFGIAEDKISVVHHGVDLSKFATQKLKIETTDKPYLLYVGSRGGYKNFAGFVKAFASSSQLKANFDVIAFGGGQFNSAEHSLIRQLGFNTTHVRQVSGGDQKLTQLYANATAFVYPSLYEGFGLPPLEAMAAGCPVVSSNTSSMPEVVRNAGEYFDPNDIESIRTAIEQVVFTEDLRRNLITAGYENIKNFSWQKSSTQTLGIYQKLTGKT
jgi:glycosyltransferase involved in cell wall biosynthesis